jgi:hypothetical protein
VSARTAAVGRNDRCTCGSGKKYKNCHGSRASALTNGQRWLYVLVAVAIVGGLMLAISSRSGDEPRTGGVWSAEHGHYH